MVGFIADGVFPEAPLPDAAGSLAETGARRRLLAATGGEERSGEGGFDRRYPAGEIRIAIGQRNQQMQMIVQKHDRIQHDRVQLAAMFDGLAKQCAGGIAVEDRCPPLCDEGEEESATGLNRPPIVGHRMIFDQRASAGNGAVGEYAHPTRLSAHTVPVPIRSLNCKSRACKLNTCVIKLIRCGTKLERCVLNSRIPGQSLIPLP